MKKQIGESDCFLACVAMLVDREIEDIYSKPYRVNIDSVKGTHGDNIDTALELAGIKRDIDCWSVAIGMGCWSYQTRALLRGRKAILQVPSLNYKNGSHMVFWDGHELFDPSNHQIYRWLNQCTPEYIWIFNESK